MLELGRGDQSLPTRTHRVQRKADLEHRRQSRGAFVEISDLLAVGNGLAYLDSLAPALRSRFHGLQPDLWPDPVDLLSLGEQAAAAGEAISALAVEPVYVRDEISWKKLAEQGKKQ